MVADPDDLALARLIDRGTIGKILVVFLAVTLKSLGFSLFLYIDGRRLTETASSSLDTTCKTWLLPVVTSSERTHWNLTGVVDSFDDNVLRIVICDQLKVYRLGISEQPLDLYGGKPIDQRSPPAG
ncbi:MAG: hypothetical protein Ct9H300mP16_03930 [Pseudomonadota bacterium]|nr:MAG: hypothetical protein Ct9H300mP16_03930 [Pseudomonadota bacterium]